jgi:hypothetical protein
MNRISFLSVIIDNCWLYFICSSEIIPPVMSCSRQYLTSRIPGNSCVLYEHREKSENHSLFRSLMVNQLYALPKCQYSCLSNSFFKKHKNKNCVLYFNISRFLEKPVYVNTISILFVVIILMLN